MSENSTWTFSAAYLLLKQPDLELYEIDSLQRFILLNSPIKAIIPDETKTNETRSSIKDAAAKLVKTVNDELIDDIELLRQILSISGLDAIKLVVKSGFASRSIEDRTERITTYIRLYLSDQRAAIKFLGLLLEPNAADINFSDIPSQFWLQVVESIRKFLTEEFVLPQIDFLEQNESIVSLLVSEASGKCLELLRLLIIGASQSPLPQDAVVQLFHLAADTEVFYFISPDTTKTVDNFAASIHSHGIIALLASLDLDDAFDQSKTYLASPESLIKLHNHLHLIFRSTKSSAPIALAWSLILDRVAILVHDSHDTKYASFLATVLGDPVPTTSAVSDPYSTPVSRTVTTDPKIALSLSSQRLSEYSGELAATALRIGALNRVVRILEELPESILYANVLRSLLQSSMPYITMTEDVARTIRSVMQPHPSLAMTFFQDEFVIRALLLAKGQVPISTMPFIILAQCLDSNETFETVRSMSSYLIALPEKFGNYEYDQGDVLLTSDCTVIPPRQADNEGAIVVPQGTTGKVLSSDPDNSSVVVFFDQEHNGWHLFFRMMEQIETDRTWDDPHEYFQFDEMVKLLSTTIAKLDDRNVAELVSLSASTFLYGDIIEMVARRLDYSLEMRNIGSCITAINFFTAILPSMPQRVWPYLSRCRLLEQHGALLETILGSIELVNGEFSFTVAVLDLAEALVKDALLDSLDSVTSESVKISVLNGLVSHTILIFESFSAWKFVHKNQKLAVGSKSMTLFRFILASSFGLVEDKSSSRKPTRILSDCCNLVTSSFFGNGERSERVFQPILGVVHHSATQNEALDCSSLMDANVVYSDLACRFAAILVRARNVSQSEPSLLEKRLFEQAGSLVQICNRYAELRSSVLSVIETLVAAEWTADHSVPSMLAFMGSEKARMFVDDLANLVGDELQSLSIYQACYCLSAIINSKQEGLSILILSGKQHTKRNSDKTIDSMSVLKALEDNVINRNKKSFPPEIMVAILEVICLAHSAWTLGTDADMKKLCQSLVEMIEELNVSSESPSKQTNATILRSSNKNSMVAKSLQILAIQLYKSPDAWLLDYLKKESKLEDLTKKFFLVRGLRLSLHGNLYRNFESKWGEKSSLDSFTRNKAFFGRKTYDMRYLYDTQIMDIILGRDPMWIGYRKEIIEANSNLCYIDSQFGLISAWCSLLSVIANHLSRTDSQNLKILQPVAEYAVTSVSPIELSLPLFHGVNKLRCDVAYFIMVLLNKAEKLSVDISTVKTTFSMLIDSNVAFTELGEASSQKQLYRMLLKLLNIELDSFIKEFSAKNAVKTKNEMISLSQVLPMIQGLVDMVAIRGMKAIAVAAQTDPTGGYVEDLVGVTLILRKCLTVPGVESLAGTWLLAMKETEVSRTVMSLFSRSLELIVNGDPIYGELTLLYFQEWLFLMPIAEYLVSEGLMRILYESPICRQIQDNGVDIADNLRLYHIWTRGIIGVVLQLLKQLRSAVLPEIVVWMGFFSTQINRSFEQWSDVSYMSFSVIEETSQLALIYFLVKLLALSDDDYTLWDKVAAKVAWVPTDVIASIDYLLDHQKYLASNIVLLTVEEQQKYMKDRTGQTLLQDIVRDLADLRQFLGQV